MLALLHEVLDAFFVSRHRDNFMSVDSCKCQYFRFHVEFE